MTIVHLKNKHLKRSKYKCDICGKVDFWSSEWSRYSSINHDEACPGDMPTACSEKCGHIMMAKINNKEFVLPKLGKISPYSCDVVKERVGY